MLGAPNSGTFVVCHGPGNEGEQDGTPSLEEEEVWGGPTPHLPLVVYAAIVKLKRSRGRREALLWFCLWATTPVAEKKELVREEEEEEHKKAKKKPAGGGGGEKKMGNSPVPS